MGTGDRRAVQAMELIRRILGLPGDRDRNTNADADDRSTGHPLRRLAEFGLLPGYEFPSEPATLRLYSDAHEEEPITVERRFGLAQYRPEAIVHARGHRWEVIGLDPASPWNPKTGTPSWHYVLCGQCELRYDAQSGGRCPRCTSSIQVGGAGLPAYEFGGFVARRSDTPVLQEEDRYAASNLLRCYPQWNGIVAARYELATGWKAHLSQGEEVRWLNEWKPPTPNEALFLHPAARGFYLCPTCGKLLTTPPPQANAQGQRQAPRRANAADPFGHAPSCAQAGRPPQPLAMVARTQATTLRISVDLPPDFDDVAYEQWGYSLGHALRTGMRQLYMLDGKEVEFELEPMWTPDSGPSRQMGTLTFIDGAVGGSGFLERAAADLHLVAARARDHLDHPGCTSACYRCLKTYQNQRIHERLCWPAIIDHLAELSSAAPVRQSAQVGDDKAPGPWLTAYAAGVGSPLEMRFLTLFREHAVPVESQVEIGVPDGALPITVADFAIPTQRVAIYIDGASFHRGAALRRDSVIRARLRSAAPPWRVVELRAADLYTFPNVLEQVRGSR